MEIKMECKNCGSPIFEGDKFCSKCGTRVAGEEPKAAEGAEEPKKPEAAGVTEEPERSEAAEVSEEPEKPEEPKKPEAAEVIKPIKSEEGKTETVKSETVNQRPLSIPEEKPSKSQSRFKGIFEKNHATFPSDKPRKWVSKVILGVLCIAAVALLANSQRLTNSWHRNFSTPEEYYRWVERKAMQEYTKSFAEYYVNHFVESLHNYDRHTSGEIRVELGDAGRDMMELAGLGSWFEKGAFTFESTSRDHVSQSILGLEIGGEKLFSIDTVMDLEDEAIYLGIPELTKTYLAVDTGERSFAKEFEDIFGMKPEEYLEHLELLEIYYKECPDKKQMEALVKRYLELLLDSIDNVKMRTGKTARAGGITQDCTTLEIYLDKDDLQDILTKFLEELRDDGEIEELLFQICELTEELDLYTGYYRDADDFYEAFRDGIDELLDDMDYYVTYHEELDMTIYVDDKGQVIGRTLEFPNSWDEVSFSYLNPHHGSKFGFKGSIIVDDGEILVTGSGKEFGNKISGSFTVKLDGSESVDIEVKDFDVKSLKKGYLNGRFTVTASSGIRRASDFYSAYSYLSDMELTIDVSSNKSSEKLYIELKEGKELWGALTITTKTGSSKKISVPSTKKSIFVETNRDFEDWWDTIEWNDLVKKMDKAGLPSDVVDTVEGFDGMDLDEVLDELSALAWAWLYNIMDELY